MVYIVGIGPGSKEYVLPKAMQTMNKSNVVLGFKRAIESLDFISSPKIEVSSLKEILNYLNNNDKDKEDICIAASGDPCYYGITNYIKNNYQGTLEVIPGLSSFQYLMCKLKMPWNEAFTGSMHGRQNEFLERVEENKISVWLTDKKNSPNGLCKKLLEEGIDAKVYIGENLSYDDEKITYGTPSDILNEEFSELCVVVIEKCNL